MIDEALDLLTRADYVADRSLATVLFFMRSVDPRRWIEARVKRVA
ncbi:hypothetical protein [Mesorhizobium sp. M0074]